MLAIRELIRLVKPTNAATARSLDQDGFSSGTGRFMVYVWALEQRGDGRRQFDTQLAEQHGVAFATDAQMQDVLVPWVKKAEAASDVWQRCALLIAQTCSYCRLPPLPRARAR